MGRRFGVSPGGWALRRHMLGVGLKWDQSRVGFLIFTILEPALEFIVVINLYARFDTHTKH